MNKNIYLTSFRLFNHYVVPYEKIPIMIFSLLFSQVFAESKSYVKYKTGNRDRCQEYYNVIGQKEFGDDSENIEAGSSHSKLRVYFYREIFQK